VSPYLPPNTPASIAQGSSRCAAWGWTVSGVLHAAAIGTLACASSHWVSPLWRALPTRDGHHCIELLGSIASPESSVERTVLELTQDDSARRPNSNPPPIPSQRSELAAGSKLAAAPTAAIVSPLLAEASDDHVRATTPQSRAALVAPRSATEGAEPLPNVDQLPQASNLPPPSARPVSAAVLPPTMVETPRPAQQVSQSSQAQPSSRRADGTESEPVPRALFNPPPEYPAAALRAGIEGRVVIRVELTHEGRVATATLHKSSGQASLDAAALAAVRRWRFEPTAGPTGKPLRSRTFAVPVRFTIER